MPTANWGDKQSFSASKFIKLKSKGDRIQFRILGNYHYDGKHFQEDSSQDSGWTITPCSRINDGAECEICEMFFAAHKSAKKEGLDRKETDKLTNPFKPAISYYFPVLNRDTEEFQVFQTTAGVKNQVDAKLEISPNNLERDMVVVRTETPGSGYYSLDIVDSADTKPLSDKEKAEMKKGQEANMEEYVNGTSSESSVDEELNF